LAASVVKLPLSAKPRASIVVAVSTVDSSLVRCLEHLARSASSVPFEALVVLNGLPSEAVSRLRKRLLGPRFLESEVNLGLAGSLNRGRAEARGEYIVSLHDDADVQPNWLDALVETADRDPGVGAVGSLVLDSDGRVQAAGWELVQDGSTRPPWKGEPPAAIEFTEPRAVDYSPSCSLLVRASTWDRIGGADERFFPLYYVDVDLCLAIRGRGERVLLQPGSTVVHHRGASTDPDFAQFVARRNRGLMLEKWGELIRLHTPGSGATFSPQYGDRLPHQADPLPGRHEREAAVAREYEADLRSRLAAQAAELGALRRQTTDLEKLSADLESRAAEATTELAWLRQRSELLTEIEQGGWWRLRSRVLPILRAAAAARQVMRGVRPGR
jgi:GT2 family glycosyltransferase